MFKSEAQRGYLYANNPSVAKEFQSKTPKDADLPEKVDLKQEAMQRVLNKRKGNNYGS